MLQTVSDRQRCDDSGSPFRCSVKETLALLLTSTLPHSRINVPSAGWSGELISSDAYAAEMLRWSDSVGGGRESEHTVTDGG